jgi:hypothetical protein
VKTDSCFSKLRNELFSFGYSGKFALCRHSFPFLRRVRSSGLNDRIG